MQVGDEVFFLDKNNTDNYIYEQSFVTEITIVEKTIVYVLSNGKSLNISSNNHKNKIEKIDNIYYCLDELQMMKYQKKLIDNAIPNIEREIGKLSKLKRKLASIKKALCF